jgi:hypothetical protein
VFKSTHQNDLKYKQKLNPKKKINKPMFVQESQIAAKFHLNILGSHTHTHTHTHTHIYIYGHE